MESVAGPGGAEYLRSGVLGLDLRTARRDGATVLAIRDPRTGEEFDGALETSERRLRTTEARASAAEDELSATKAELSAIKAEVGAASACASTAEERVRELDRRLRELTGQAGPAGRDSQG